MLIPTNSIPKSTNTNTAASTTASQNVGESQQYEGKDMGGGAYTPFRKKQKEENEEPSSQQSDNGGIDVVA